MDIKEWHVWERQKRRDELYSFCRGLRSHMKFSAVCMPGLHGTRSSLSETVAFLACCKLLEQPTYMQGIRYTINYILQVGKHPLGHY